ncbi:MAG: MobA/MobL family protein [Candidatus Bathyarchaeota archaeon]|nr:MobA/MobL family protein [Candidatus Termiticorpusculum sp.]
MTGIYHLSVKIISRGSGRSAVGAAAYRAGEKLHAVRAAAYRSGEELRDPDDEIIHDYTRKTGVAHKEIILPKGAPEEYRDRETLWNAVEASEKRHDARLAREVEVALQAKFDLEEQKAMLREYIKENFVAKGMIADFAIHIKGSGNLNSPAEGVASGVRNQQRESALTPAANPHAHIMLTTRRIAPDGFKEKVRDWDSRENLLKWRKNWAEINNRLLEQKGLEERIDHRSYRAQGVEQEPTIHLGSQAWALEKRGIRTERGDYNREVRRRNAERAANRISPVEGVASGVRNQTPETAHHHAANAERSALKEAKQQQKQESAKNTAHKEKPQKWREPEKISGYTEKSLEPKPDGESPFISELEKQLKAEKAMQHIEKMQARDDTAKTAKNMNELKEKYVELEVGKNRLISQGNKEKSELPSLEYRAESVEEHAQNIGVLQGRVERLREARRSVGFLDLKKKKELDEKIAQASQELGRAQDYFKNRFRIDPSQANEEIKRLQEEIRAKNDELTAKQTIVQAIRKKQESIELEYRTQKLLNETRPDHEQITQLLEQMRKPSQSPREQQIQESIERRLEVITDYGFEKAIEKLPPYQAHLLTTLREQAKEREKLLREEDERRHQTFTRSR